MTEFSAQDSKSHNAGQAEFLPGATEDESTPKLVQVVAELSPPAVD